MKKVSKGNWLIERGGTQADEIGQLSQVFEGMVAQLETLIHDVIRKPAGPSVNPSSRRCKHRSIHTFYTIAWTT